jgi:hypothetical protein
MIEAHPIIFLICILVILVTFSILNDVDPDACGSAVIVVFIVWLAWLPFIPDTPEQIKAAQEAKIKREEDARQKAIPHAMSEADGCTVYVFERQGREHFFTRCEKTTSTETNWTEGCGKGCSKPMHDTILTPNK